MIETKKIRDGEYIGKIVWICHYHRPDMQKKPLRCIPPTKVIVVSNDDLPKNKTVYYSKAHFRPLNKDDKPLSKVISPVDNTGYRGRIGNELYVFDNYLDCKKHWNLQLQEYFKRLDDLIDNAANRWKEEKSKLEGMIAI